MGNGGQMKAGGPSPAVPQPAPPQLLEELSVRSWVPSVLSPCKNGSSRKWLNPMYFYTQHTPVRPGRIIRSRCVGGGMRYVWGKGFNTKKEPDHTHRNRKQPVPITGRSHWTRLLPRCSYWKTLLKTEALPKPGARGGCSSVGFLWGLFKSQLLWGYWGQRQSLLQSLPSRLLWVSLGVPWPSLWVLIPSESGSSNFLTLYTRGANSTVYFK